MRNVRWAGAGLAAVALIAAGCGRGGDVPPGPHVPADAPVPPASADPGPTTGAGSAPVPVPPLPSPPSGAVRSAEGIWRSASAGTGTIAVVLETGQLWIASTLDGRVSRLVEGTTRTGGGLLTSSDALDFRPDSPTPASVTGRYTAKDALSGVASTAGRAVLDFATAYAPSYEQPATHASTAGNWQATLPDGRDVQLGVAPSGVLSAVTSDGCASTGWLLPRASGRNVHTALLSFGPGCALAGRTTTGVGIRLPGEAAGSPERLLVATVDAARSGAFAALFTASTIAPVPPPPPPPAPAPPPPVPPGRTISGAELLSALKGYAMRAPGLGGPPPGWLPLASPDAPRPTTSTGAGGLLAWSQLLVGGQATVSSVASHLTGRPSLTIEFLTSSGPTAYVANLLLVGAGERIRFDQVLRLDASGRVALDVPLFVWRRRWPSGAATVALVPRSLQDAPTGFRLCWETKLGELDRRVCTRHGDDRAADVVDDHLGEIVRLESAAGAIPWNPTPPEGVPAPPLAERPIRYAYGTEVASAIAQPRLGPLPDNAAALAAEDGSGSTARLSATRETDPALGGLPRARGRARFTSTVDRIRPATISFSTGFSPRFGDRGDVSELVLDADGRERPARGSHAHDSQGIYPLDVELARFDADGDAVTLLLRSAGDGPDGFRLCWRTTLNAGTLRREACSVEGRPGWSGELVDAFAGTERTYR